MKGRFDRSEQTIKQLMDQINSMNTHIHTLQAAPPKAAEPVEKKRYVTEQEEHEYGSEFLSVVGKKAKEEIDGTVGELHQRIKQLQDRLDGVGQNIVQDARGRLFETLDTRLSNWREVNDNPEFLQWLSLPDLYTGVIRQQLLNAAFERNDGPRVLAFFQGFLSEEAAMAPAPVSQAASPEPVASRKIPLETFAAPGRAKTAAAPAPVEKPSFTRVQISQFYADAAAGRYRGREAEKDRIEASIFAAEREGRIH
jgi:hypothetical protein